MDKRTAGIKLITFVNNSNRIAALELGIFGSSYKEIIKNLKAYDLQCEKEMEQEFEHLENSLKRNNK